MGILRSKKNQDIDLLTEEESVKSLGNKLLIVFIAAGLLLVQLVVFVSLLFLNLTSKQKLASLKTEIEALSITPGNLGKVGNDLRLIKAKLRNYEELVNKYSGMDKKLTKIAQSVPSEVLLLTLTLNYQGKVTMKAASSNPEVAYQFYEVLFSDASVSNLSLDAITKTAAGYTFDLSFVTNVK